MSKTVEERRKSNAARQEKLRAERDAAGVCRTCGAPAAVSKRTGRLARQCGRHLAVDKDRKALRELPWGGKVARIPAERVTPLRWEAVRRISERTIPLYWHDDPRITG